MKKDTSAGLMEAHACTHVDVFIWHNNDTYFHNYVHPTTFHEHLDIAIISYTAGKKQSSK